VNDDDEMVSVTSVEWLGGHRLRLGFSNGDRGEVDLSKHLKFRGVLEPLRDPDFVAKVRVDPEAGTISWPGDLDLDPLVLHHRATGKPLPKWAGPIEGL
jgi:hypothetical protein